VVLAALAVPLLRADEDIKARIAAAGDAGKHDADAVVVVDWKDVTVRANGIGTAREHRVTKVLREAAIRHLAVQRFPFDPHTNRLDLIAVRVYRADGAVEEVPLESARKQPQTAWGIFWPTDQYLLEVPRLGVGDAVETIVEMTGFNVAYLAEEEERNAYGVVLKPPVPGHWHDEAHFWTEGYPIIEKRYSVRLPKDKPLQYEVYNGELRPAVLFQGDQICYTFEKKDLKPVRPEPSMENWPNVETKLLLATLPSWEDKARWLYEVSEPQFEADDAIRAKVAEIIKDCQTDEEKYTALNHWVAENIRYAGTSRGMCEGYTVHRSIETFHDRCGVCKDKAGMLVTMLRVAGFDSFLVMTMARQRVDRIPADQFNHAVTCIRRPDGSLILLDPTWMPKSRDNWSTLEPEQHVVYGLPEGGGLAQSPYFPPEDCQASWKADTTITADNKLAGKLHFWANGAPETRFRRALAAMPPADRADYFERAFQRLGSNAAVNRLECTEPTDFSGPLTVAAEFEVDGYVLGQGPRRYLALPMLQQVFGDRTLYDLFGNTSAEKRRYGLKLLATRLGRFEETITLPANWNVTRQPDPVDIDGPAAGLHFSIQVEPGCIRYTCDLLVKKWTIPPDDYANFKQVIDKFEELAGRVITCEVEDADAQR